MPLQLLRQWLSSPSSALQTRAVRLNTRHRLGCEALEGRVTPAFLGGVTVAVGDIDGDGYADIVTGAGAGGGPHVKVFSGQSGQVVRSFFAYDPGFQGGVHVAVGDVNGDGHLDIVTGAGAGGGPHVKAFDGVTGTAVFSALVYAPGFSGGVSVAVGDLDGDGRAEVVTGSGAGGGPHVRAFDTRTGGIVRDFFAFSPAFLGGVSVAVGDVTGDGGADIVTGAGAGGGPQVQIYDGRSQSPWASYWAFTPGFRGGLQVATDDVDGDGTADVIAAAGPGGGPHVRAFAGRDGHELAGQFPFDSGYTLGLNIAAGDLDGDGWADLVVGAGFGNLPRVKGIGTAARVVADFSAYAPVSLPGPFSRRRSGSPSPAPTPLNSPPTISAIADQSYLDGEVPVPIAFVVGDAESTADSLTVTAVSSNTQLLPQGSIRVGGAGRARTLTLTPADGRTGTASITVTVTDAGGATASATFRVTVAPVSPVQPVYTSTADFSAATNFLYTGTNPRQTGVSPGTIDPIRAAVLRGKVVGLDGQPVSAVVVTVLDHPEFGQTTTLADGTFDLAVNGGGLLTVAYTKAGFLNLQRQADVAWQDYTILPQVALTPFDDRVTAIDLTAATPIQVAQGSVETDADGTRQATLLFRQGTQATMTLADGSTQALSTLQVRATEYTVGASGPSAMPGTLPATSGYTYAVELSIDEAEQAGATRVDFSQAVPFYVQNFLNFPVGTAVPAGYYDRQRGLWVPEDNGRVVQVLSVAGGIAQLDGDGDGDADTDGELAAVGVTVAEQTQLASLYSAGDSLWRVPLTHFSPWDYNWPYGPPPDAVPPRTDPDELQDDKQDEQNKACGSVIGIENQTLGESIPVAGTPFSLVYQSDRVSGRTAERTLTIPLTPATLPASLRRVELTISVAGREFRSTFQPSANLSTQFTWDGRDAYGRSLQGNQRVGVNIGYVYGLATYQTPAAFAQSFAVLSGVPMSGNQYRRELTLSQAISTALNSPSEFAAATVGGWTLDILHSYDPGSRVLHLGTGQDRSGQDTGTNGVIDFAGNRTFGFAGDGGPATSARLDFPFGIATGADGSVYIADRNNNRIRRVAPDGVISTFAGNGTYGSGGDGGPATAASFRAPFGVAVGPDGSVFITEFGQNVIRRVKPDGIISTVAGSGITGFGGDGGPATAAKLSTPMGVAVGPDGSLYIADSSNHRIRRVAPDGIISTVAGTGMSGASGDGGRAATAQLYFPAGVAVGPDGSLYIADEGNSRIRRVGLNGVITTVAGGGAGDPGDGGLATSARLVEPFGVAVGPDGSFYVADSYNQRIRRIGSDGVITTLVRSQFQYFGVAIGPDGNVYFSVWNTPLVQRLSSTFPGVKLGTLDIPSEDGREVYRFSSSGRHLQTLDALTGTAIYTFGYDAAGRLVSVTDADNNVTTIARDANGNPTAIVSPFGQRTTLAVNAGGYLSRVTNPANESYKLGYATGGLLTSFSDPRGNTSVMKYDSAGRLIEDQDPEFGFTKLSRQTLGAGSYKVTTTNAEGGTRQYLVEKQPDGSTKRTAIDGRGFATVTVIGTDGSRKTTLPDGTVTTTAYGPDPRFGMLAPVVTSQTVKTPSGLTSTTTGSRTATFATASDPTSALRTLTDTVVVNGKTFTTAYTAAGNTITTTTAQGRIAVTTLDAKGRVASVKLPGVAATVYAYDARGRLSSVTQDTRSVTYAYDSRSNLARITDPLGRTTTFTYDAADRLTRQTQPDGVVIAFRYDAEGNLLGLTPPGRPEHTFAYNDHDDVTTTTAPDVGPGDDTTRYVYNLAHQVIRETLPGGDEIDYTYCECGRLTAINAPWGAYTYTFSTTTGVLSSLASPGGFTLTTGRDGILTTSATLTGPVSGAVNWTYDSNFRVVSESVNGANAVTFAYDGDDLLTRAGALTIARDAASGRLTGTTLGTVADAVSYSTYGELSGYRADIGGSPAMQDTFTRDDLGRITRKVETVGGITTTTDYGYDAKGQLATVTENGVLVQAFTYDANGNRLRLTTPSGAVNGTYDNQDRLLTYGTKAYTYADDGSLRAVVDSATGQRTDYTYDGFGNLTRVALPDGRVIEYLIDGRNRRVGKKIDGVLTQGLLYDGQLTPVAQLDASGSVVARFVYATGVNVPAYMVKGGITYRLITDHLGSVRLVVNTATGAIAQRLDYDAFGRVVLDTNPDFQPFGYAGGLYDADTGLVRFGARDYDAETGRWMARDPIGFNGGQANLYGYVGNSPQNLVDITGLEPNDILVPSVDPGYGPAIGDYDPQSVGEIYSKQGLVQIKRNGVWREARVGEKLHPDDTVRTGLDSKAAVLCTKGERKGVLTRLNETTVYEESGPINSSRPPETPLVTTSIRG